MPELIGILETFLTLVIEQQLLRSFCYVLLFHAAHHYEIYLDSVMTYGLLRSYSLKQEHALCGWDRQLQRCSRDAYSLALVDATGQRLMDVLVPPQSRWHFSSFTSKNDRLILAPTSSGIVNGRFHLTSLLGEHQVILAPSGRLTFKTDPNMT